jgi:hypothetical protein
MKHHVATSEHATMGQEQVSVQPSTRMKHHAATSEHATMWVSK